MFSATDSKLPNRATLDVNSIQPELILMNKNYFFGFDFAFQYQHSSSSDINSKMIDVDSYGLKASPVLDIFKLFKIPSSSGSLLVPLSFAYAGSSSQTTVSNEKTQSTANTYSFGPSISYSKSLNNSLSFTISPAFVLQWKDSSTSGNPQNTKADQFTTLARFDISLTQSLKFSPQASVYRDVYKYGFASPTSELLTYGQFGAGLRYSLTKRIALSVVYGYVAFNSQLETHNVSAKVDIAF